MEDRAKAKPQGEKATKRSSVYRHYCCICSNYRGKIVDLKRITLHRFPSDTWLQTGWIRWIRWIRCIQLVIPSFRLGGNDRLCSAHFVGSVFRKGQLPSVFKLSSGNIKIIETEVVSKEHKQSTSHYTKTDRKADTRSQSFKCGDFESSERTSVLLHDYCGMVDARNISQKLDKSEQTFVPVQDSSSSTRSNCFRHDTVSLRTQTENCTVESCDSGNICQNIVHHNNQQMHSVGHQLDTSVATT